MKHMKIVSLLSIFASLALAGCSGQSGTSSSSSSSNSSSLVSSSSSSSSSSSTQEVTLDTLWNDYDTVTIAEAIELMPADGSKTPDRYYIKGRIKEITDYSFGAMIIEDDTGTLEVYGTYSADGADHWDAIDPQPTVGDFVLLHSILQNYKGTPEIQNGRLIDFYANTPTETIDPSEYEEVSIAEARTRQIGEKVRVSGVVTAYTYDNKADEAGFLIQDGSASIVVYDAAAAHSVKIGNRIEVAGERDNYISSKETAAAEEIGYTGAIQLVDATILSNDESTATPDLSWAPTTSMKDVLATPASENITGNIVRATALIKREEGGNFVNFYIDDLDGYTGTYCYSTASGAEFTWMEPFDGKVCDVYFAILNGKAANNEITWRALPISMTTIDGYTMDATKVPQFALDYYIVDQFLDTYTADPKLTVPTSLTSPNEYVDFTGLTISYTSSDESLAWFAQEGENLVFHTSEEKTGEVKLTLKATQGANTATAELTLNIAEPPHFDTITVREAIESTDNTQVTVEGVVGPSLVVQDGFYLIDETGSIPVVLKNSDALADIAQGQTVTIQGTKGIKSSNGMTFGQIDIYNAEVVYNKFGNTAYSTASFITDKTLADAMALDVNDNLNSVKVFTLENMKFAKTDAMYATYYVTDFDTDLAALEDWDEAGIQLYSSSSSQFAWLDPFIKAGEPVTIELAMSNFNSKSFFKANVLSVTDAEGNQTFNTLKVGVQD